MRGKTNPKTVLTKMNRLNMETGAYLCTCADFPEHVFFQAATQHTLTICFLSTTLCKILNVFAASHSVSSGFTLRNDACVSFSAILFGFIGVIPVSNLYFCILYTRSVDFWHAICGVIFEG